jgi:putative restriction endonuclease
VRRRATPTRSLVIGVTDREWFDYLSSRASGGRIDEVNFWSPSAATPVASQRPGEPFFFRLKSPVNAVAGYGFFASFARLPLYEAWAMFGWKNGDPDQVRFLSRIGEYRKQDLRALRAPRALLACTILRDATFWPRSRWRPWGRERGWKGQNVRGGYERDAARSSELLAEIANDRFGLPEPEDFAEAFVLQDVDERELVLARARERLGQGTFRTRLIQAWDGACAITGEHTQPVLDAAHIQPYLGPRSNHPQNGLLLCKELHALFDEGYVTVTPEHVVRVSRRLRADWDNGRRYEPFDGRRLDHLPRDAGQRPSRAALAWHGAVVFRG